MPDQPALQASRPTLALDGTDSATLTGGLLRLRVRADVHGLSSCEAEFGNWGPKGDASDFLYFDRSLLDFGKELQVKVGTTALFAGKITALEARFPEGNAPSLVVLAEDRFQDLRMTRRTRTFADLADSDVFSLIAGEHGLSPSVGVDGPAHRVLAQVNQSDLAFLRERARALDAELWISDSTLNVQPRANRGTTSVTLTYGKELRELRVVADLAGQTTSLGVTGWDVAGKQAVAETADDSVVGSELNGGDSGPSILRSAFGERKDALANSVPLTSDEAHARAEALLKRRARRFVVGHGVVETRPELQVGTKVTLAGVGKLFEGDFYLAAAQHLFDGAAGLRTEIELERPALGRAA